MSKIHKKRIIWSIVTLVIIWLLSTCIFPLPPEIGRNLPSNIREADKMFEERLQATFALGSKENDMLAEIERQGFTIVHDEISGPYANFIKRGFPCHSAWRIIWKADKGLITDIKGVYGTKCL